jgi:hypothetical protein
VTDHSSLSELLTFLALTKPLQAVALDHCANDLTRFLPVRPLGSTMIQVRIRFSLSLSGCSRAPCIWRIITDSTLLLCDRRSAVICTSASRFGAKNLSLLLLLLLLDAVLRCPSLDRHRVHLQHPHRRPTRSRRSCWRSQSASPATPSSRDTTGSPSCTAR